jgi:hypothetical protein
MSLETWSADWTMVGLRVTRRETGGVEFDLVWRSRGATQLVQPIASLFHSWSYLDEPKAEYIESVLLEAVRTMIKAMVDTEKEFHV